MPISGNKQAITRVNVDPHLCHHMVSLGHRPQWVNSLASEKIDDILQTTFPNTFPLKEKFYLLLSCLHLAKAMACHRMNIKSWTVSVMISALICIYALSVYWIVKCHFHIYNYQYFVYMWYRLIMISPNLWFGMLLNFSCDVQVLFDIYQHS